MEQNECPQHAWHVQVVVDSSIQQNYFALGIYLTIMCKTTGKSYNISMAHSVAKFAYFKN